MRVSGQTGTGPGVATVREQERLRDRPASMLTLRVAVGQFGGLGALTRSLTRELRAAGAHVMPLDEPDAVAQAGAANHFGAHVYLGFEGTQDTRSTVHFYKVPTFESVGGRALATCLVTQLASVDLVVAAPCGMRLPVLRETKMPAVLCSLGPLRLVLDLAPDLTRAVMLALSVWTTHPI